LKKVRHAKRYASNQIRGKFGSLILLYPNAALVNHQGIRHMGIKLFIITLLSVIIATVLVYFSYTFAEIAFTKSQLMYFYLLLFALYGIATFFTKKLSHNIPLAYALILGSSVTICLLDRISFGHWIVYWDRLILGNIFFPLFLFAMSLPIYYCRKILTKRLKR
jgi:hypothetical protein